MVTNRILDYSPSHEEALVSRILIMVHKAIDDHLPSAQEANRQFTKTAFSVHEGEDTAAVKTSDKRPTSPSEKPPKPASQEPPSAKGAADTPATPPEKDPSANTAGPSQPPSYISHLDPLASKVEAKLAAELNGHSSQETIRTRIPVDIGTRILLAFLLAGVVLLAYVLFS